MNMQQLEVPDSLQVQLRQFRRRVWTIKLLEAVALAVCAILLGLLCVFAFDRLGDSPRIVRMAVWLAAAACCAVVPWFLYRWLWRRRSLEQLARLLTQRMPRLGDQLLGIIELSHDQSEQARSPALCAAAIAQVADESQQQDFARAAPPSRLGLWSTAALGSCLVVVSLAAAFPEATANAWDRFTAPWRPTPRYTFASVAALPSELIVPHGEPFQFVARLDPASRWKPSSATAQIDAQLSLETSLTDDGYRFQLPPQIVQGTLTLHVGDATHKIAIVPTPRPELAAVAARISLPEYLGRGDDERKDVRGGTVSMVKGSRAYITATATRRLATATVDGRPSTPQGANLASGEREILADHQVVFNWEDELGLAAKEPFTLTIAALDDQPPSVLSERLERQLVVLDTELISFAVKAHDDFGVRRVGYQWQGFSEAKGQDAARGEKLLAAGGPDQRALDADAAFSAKSLGIEPQPLKLRLFVEDYNPERGRVYSPTSLVYVLGPEQHAIWMTQQLGKWHRRSLEVRDREMRLYETNRELRDLPTEQLDAPETRRQIQRQAAAERANGQRLARLSSAGGNLIRQARRNPEIGVGHLERWAAMLQVLDDISANRMPTVADLLTESARAPSVAGAATPTGPQAGVHRASRSGGGSEELPAVAEHPPTPSLVDMESSQQPADDDSDDDLAANATPSSPGRLTLPTTTLLGKAGGGEDGPAEETAEEIIDEAVEQQADLLTEFEKVAAEMNEILANLEGSTLVKRLKAAAREQLHIAGQINEQLEQSFGRGRRALSDEPRSVFSELENQESQSSRTVSVIMDDMQAYLQRRRMVRFKDILDDMRSQDVVGALRDLAGDIPAEQGLSIAMCEFWSDSLDRWAEDLVDPACSGSCPGSKSPGSLPPSLVLEALQILEAEVNLREETRVAQQAAPAQHPDDHRDEARRLSGTQAEVGGRVDRLIESIRELPEGASRFAPEMELLTAVASVMDEAATILARPETGPPALAAETEAIELLLRNKRINPGGGGSGGATPGGGGGGDTSDAALALVGRGANEQAVERDSNVAQSSGAAGNALPEEFRAGLDEYFYRLERE